MLLQKCAFQPRSRTVTAVSTYELVVLRPLTGVAAHAASRPSFLRAQRITDSIVRSGRAYSYLPYLAAPVGIYIVGGTRKIRANLEKMMRRILNCLWSPATTKGCRKHLRGTAMSHASDTKQYGSGKISKSEFLVKGLKSLLLRTLMWLNMRGKDTRTNHLWRG